MNDYYMQHRPDKDGARMHDVERDPAGDAVMPDYYAHPEYYRTGDAECDGPSERAILRARGNPDQPVWIWRAVPPDVYAKPGPHIHPGDWVTTSKPYARQHAAQDDDPANDWPIASRRVRARDLTTDGNSVNEWGYFPEED